MFQEHYSGGGWIFVKQKSKKYLFTFVVVCVKIFELKGEIKMFKNSSEKFVWIKDLEFGLKLVKLNDKSEGMAILDRDGNLSNFRLGAINTQFYDDFALVNVVFDEDYSYLTYLDKNGKLLPYVFKEAYNFSCGMGRVHLFDGTGWSYINKDGKLLDKRYFFAEDFYDDRARVCLKPEKKSVIIDKNGEILKVIGVEKTL